MNEELLNNIWNYLTSQGQIQVSFEEWKDNVSDNQEIQINIHKYLTDKGEITNTFEEWQDKTGLKKSRRGSTGYTPRRNHYGIRFGNWFFGLSRVRIRSSRR